MVSGRRKGDKRVKPRYILRYLDTNDTIPMWIEHELASYADMIKLLEDRYNEKYTRDTLQNIRLNRNNKKRYYPHLQISEIQY